MFKNNDPKKDNSKPKVYYKKFIWINLDLVNVNLLY